MDLTILLLTLPPTQFINLFHLDNHKLNLQIQTTTNNKCLST